VALDSARQGRQPARRRRRWQFRRSLKVGRRKEEEEEAAAARSRDGLGLEMEDAASNGLRMCARKPAKPERGSSVDEERRHRPVTYVRARGWLDERAYVTRQGVATRTCRKKFSYIYIASINTVLVFST
jgi:hypothetical protein